MHDTRTLWLGEGGDQGGQFPGMYLAGTTS